MIHYRLFYLVSFQSFSSSCTEWQNYQFHPKAFPCGHPVKDPATNQRNRQTPCRCPKLPRHVNRRGNNRSMEAACTNRGPPAGTASLRRSLGSQPVKLDQAPSTASALTSSGYLWNTSSIRVAEFFNQLCSKLIQSCMQSTPQSSQVLSRLKKMLLHQVSFTHSFIHLFTDMIYRLMIGYRSLPVNRTNLGQVSNYKEHVPYVISQKMRT